MTLLTRLSLANRLIVGMITIAILGFGVFVAGSLKQELWPSTTPPGAFIAASYEGASAASIEKDVTTPLEQAVRGVTGVKKVESYSMDGSSQVTVTWDYGQDATRIEADLRTAVAGLKSSLPASATTEIYAGAPDALAAMELTIGSSEETTAFAARITSTVLPALKAVPGIAAAKVSGEDAAGIVITVKPAELEARGLTIEDVSTLIRTSGQSVAAGTSKDGDDRLAIQVGGGVVDSLDALASLPLQHKDGPSPLSAVATVESVAADRTTIARADGHPSLNVSLTKTADGNLVQISNAVRALLPELERSLGNSARITVVADQAPEIERSVADLTTEGGLGLLFAVIVILVFLASFRSTLIAAVSIPLSILITLIVLWITGATLNVFSLAALTVAVGRVVDDSIVVIENIVRRGRKVPISPTSIVESVRQVAGAVVGSTLTTVAVFLPIAFVPGVTGELFRPFALTTSIALLASLVVSLTIVPVLAYWFLRGSGGRRAAPIDGTGAEVDADVIEQSSRLQRWYLPVLDIALKRPVAAVLVAVLLLVGTVAAAPLLKQDFIGETAAKDRVNIQQTLPPGTDLDTTSDAAAEVEGVLAKTSGVDGYLTNVGGGTESNFAFFTVNLEGGADRVSVERSIRASVKQLSDVGEVIVGDSGFAGGGGSSGGGGFGGLAIDLQGTDAASLAKASDLVVQMLAGIDGLVEPRSNLADEAPILAVKVDRAAAARYGFTVEQVGRAVSSALRGTEAGTIVLDGKEHQVRLVGQPVGDTPADIAALPLPVSAAQQEAAVKAATDALKAADDAKAQQLKDETSAAQTKARNQARADRADAVKQLADARAQLDAFLASPSANTGPVGPSDPDAEARAAAEAQRAEQLAALQGAVDAAQAAITAAGEQVKSLDKQDEEAAKAEAEALQAKQSQEAILNLKASPIPVSAVAEVVREGAPASIRKVDGLRTVTINAGTEAADLSTITAAVRQGLSKLDLPAGVTPVVGGVVEEQAQSFDALGTAMLIALLIVFIIMVAMFRSLAQALLLLVSVPFAATGAVAGLLLTGTALGVPALIGLLMLIGIVVTNAIVLLDLVNASRREGMTVLDAVRHGASLRLRPILMTACATVFALLPMAIGVTGGGQFISKSLAVVVIGGLVSSTLLTLVIVPVVYTLVERGKERRRERRAERRRGAVDGSDDGAGPDGGDAATDAVDVVRSSLES